MQQLVLIALFSAAVAGCAAGGPSTQASDASGDDCVRRTGSNLCSKHGRVQSSATDELGKEDLRHVLDSRPPAGYGR